MTEAVDYRVFGLRVRSAIGLPDLPQEPRSGEPDVTVALGPVPEDAAKAGVLFSFEGAGRYWVVGGNHILVDPVAGAPSANVRLYLLGSAMGVLLHQRGLLPLHANAIRIDGRAFAFMGSSGAGKSTLAATFHDGGYEVMADDVCVVGFDEDEGPFVTAGIPRLRLWEDSLAATGRTSDGFDLSYAGDDQFRKFDVPLPAGSVPAKSPLGGIYQLEKSDALQFTRLSGVEAVDALFANTYRGAFVRTAGNSNAHWAAVLRLARHVPIFRLARPWNMEAMAAHLDQISAHARQMKLR